MNCTTTLDRLKIAFVEVSIRFAISVPVDVTVLFPLAATGEISQLPFEIKRTERLRLGKPLRGIRKNGGKNTHSWRPW